MGGGGSGGEGGLCEGLVIMPYCEGGVLCRLPKDPGGVALVCLAYCCWLMADGLPKVEDCCCGGYSDELCEDVDLMEAEDSLGIVEPPPPRP